jgi:hypothetical protein
MGGRGRLRELRRWLSWDKHVGAALVKCGAAFNPRCDVSWRTSRRLPAKDDITTSTRSTEAANVYDTVRQNYVRIVDEFTKAQPQYTQSVSNLQLDYIAATKNTIQNMVSAQKLLASNGNVPMITPPYTDEFVKQSNEITENIVRAVRINNQLTVNAINAAAENFRTLNRTIESVTEFNTSAAKAWNSFLTVQQQQFLHTQ